MQVLSVCEQDYCLSNAMHGQNINLPVCVCVSVCVCPSHFLSTRPYRSDPSTDFYSYSLTDADLRKDMPFGVSMMNNHI